MVVSPYERPYVMQAKLLNKCIFAVFVIIQLGTALNSFGQEEKQDESLRLFLAGRKLQDSGNAPKAMELYKQSARLGNTDAMYNLGHAYAQGDGIAKDTKVAYHWFEKGHKRGDYGCTGALAACYHNGWGVNKDLKRSIELHLVAARNGITYSMVTMYLVYRDGYGAEKDLAAAMYWRKKSADAGDTETLREFGVDYAQGSRKWNIKRNDKKATEYWFDAAKRGDPASMGLLGAFYWDGRGVPRNEILAYYWIGKGAQKGDEYSKDFISRKAMYNTLSFIDLFANQFAPVDNSRDPYDSHAILTRRYAKEQRLIREKIKRDRKSTGF